jgi:predicted membrane metal-binding protein
MSLPMLILCGVLLVAFVALIFGKKSRGRSILLGLFGVSLAAMGALGSWYSWVEPRGSLAFAVGYGVISLCGAIVGFRQATALAARA